MYLALKPCVVAAAGRPGLTESEQKCRTQNRVLSKA